MINVEVTPEKIIVTGKLHRSFVEKITKLTCRGLRQPIEVNGSYVHGTCKGRPMSRSGFSLKEVSNDVIKADGTVLMDAYIPLHSLLVYSKYKVSIVNGEEEFLK